MHSFDAKPPTTNLKISSPCHPVRTSKVSSVDSICYWEGGPAVIPLVIKLPALWLVLTRDWVSVFVFWEALSSNADRWMANSKDLPTTMEIADCMHPSTLWGIATYGVCVVVRGGRKCAEVSESWWRAVIRFSQANLACQSTPWHGWWLLAIIPYSWSSEMSVVRDIRRKIHRNAATSIKSPS